MPLVREEAGEDLVKEEVVERLGVGAGRCPHFDASVIEVDIEHSHAPKAQEGSVIVLVWLHPRPLITVRRRMAAVKGHLRWASSAPKRRRSSNCPCWLEMEASGKTVGGSES